MYTPWSLGSGSVFENLHVKECWAWKMEHLVACLSSFTRMLYTVCHSTQELAWYWKNDGYLNECSKNKLCNKYVTVLNDSDLSLNDVIKVYFNFILWEGFLRL